MRLYHRDADDDECGRDWEWEIRFGGREGFRGAHSDTSDAMVGQGGRLGNRGDGERWSGGEVALQAERDTGSRAIGTVRREMKP